MSDGMTAEQKMEKRWEDMDKMNSNIARSLEKLLKNCAKTAVGERSIHPGYTNHKMTDKMKKMSEELHAKLCKQPRDDEGIKKLRKDMTMDEKDSKRRSDDKYKNAARKGMRDNDPRSL